MIIRKTLINITLVSIMLLSAFDARTQSADTMAIEVLPDTISINISPKPEKVYNKKPKGNINSYIRKGDNIFNDEEKRYDLALIKYLQAEDLGGNTEHLYYSIAYSYFKLKKYKQAKPYFEKIVYASNFEEKEALYLLARTNHLQYEFDSAVFYYNRFYSVLSKEELSERRFDILKRKRESTIAKDFVDNPVNARVEILDTNINTRYVEYAPLASINDSLLIFSSRRPGKKDGNRDHMGRYFDKIYFSVKQSDGSWAKAEVMPKSINTVDHSAAAGLSADGKKLIVYKSVNNGDLFISTFKNGEWKKAKKIKGVVNTEFHEATASFSYDRTKMYFTSDREGGYGGHDIYISTVDEDGKWGNVDNLNSFINTTSDEISMVALPDEKTYYFTSNGHNSMGGFDIFKTTYIEGKWSPAINLGYPINTPDDDILYSVSADGKFAYVASSRNDSTLHDIYKIRFAVPIKPVSYDLDGIMLVVSKHGAILPKIDGVKNIKKLDLTVLKGTIYDVFNKEPLYADIELTDNKTNKVVATFTSNKQTGKYLVSLPSGKDYGIAVKVENYLFHSENITINNSKGYKEIIKDISLNRISVGSKVVLNNVFFATGKAEISQSSETELKNLLNLLNNVPSLKLEIAGHTDSVGKSSSNKRLSTKRAEAVVKYLIKNGISSNRLIAKGYGEDVPVASNKTKAGRQKNRRTEFEVIAR